MAVDFVLNVKIPIILEKSYLLNRPPGTATIGLGVGINDGVGCGWGVLSSVLSNPIGGRPGCMIGMLFTTVPLVTNSCGRGIDGPWDMSVRLRGRVRSGAPVSS